jgi:hypothetical protein
MVFQGYLLNWIKGLAFYKYCNTSIEKLKQKYIVQGLSKSSIKQLIIKKVFLRQYKNAKPSYFEDMLTVWNGYCIVGQSL